MKFKVLLPIYGFEKEKEFDLEVLEEGFYKLVGQNVTFHLMSPFLVLKDYEFEVDDEYQEKLKLDNDKEILVLNILVLNQKFLDSTINLAAPLIFNLTDHLMGQIILKDGNYPLEAKLSDFIKDKQ